MFSAGKKSERNSRTSSDEGGLDGPEPELGARFLSAVAAKVEQVLAFPESAQVAYRAVRQAKVRGFPYSIFYKIHEELLVVVAVMHASRHPDAWKP